DETSPVPSSISRPVAEPERHGGGRGRPRRRLQQRLHLHHQQRLVEFARCLMLDPSLIILDEPSMGLAPKVLRSVFGAITMMNTDGKTVLLVEQNARAGLRLSTDGVVLEIGRVRLAGSGQE